MAEIGPPGLPLDRRQQDWKLRKERGSAREIARTIGAPASRLGDDQTWPHRTGVRSS